jgi:hypothetical protein
MLKKALTLLLLAGCCTPEPPPPNPGLTAAEQELQDVRAAISTARTARIVLRGEWPHAIARMPRSVTGTVLLGEGGKAKITLKSMYAGGGFETYEAVSDGKRMWRSPRVEAAKFQPAGGLRDELVMALAWYGIGWSFPQGPHPKTLGEGYVICDLIPQVRDRSPSRMDAGDGALRTISHESPGVDYRIRLSADSATHQMRKRELLGEGAKVWYVESYPEVVLNTAIPDEEFKVPGN